MVISLMDIRRNWNWAAFFVLILLIGVGIGISKFSNRDSKNFQKLEKSDKSYIIAEIPDINASRIYYLYKGEKYRGIFYTDLKPALDWIRSETPREAIISSWWDYGHSLRGYSRRGTIAFSPSKKAAETILPPGTGSWNQGLEGNFSSEERLRDLAHIFTKKPDIAVRIMEEYNSSYLLMSRSEVRKYTAINTVSSNYTKVSQGYGPITTYDLSDKSVRENKLLLRFQGRRGEVEVTVSRHNDSYKVSQPPVLKINQRSHEIGCIFTDRDRYLEEAGAPSPFCISFLPYQNLEKAATEGFRKTDTQVAIIPKDITNSNFVQLYFRNGQNTERFRRVWRDQNSEIWKINEG